LITGTDFRKDMFTSLVTVEGLYWCSNFYCSLYLKKIKIMWLLWLSFF